MVTTVQVHEDTLDLLKRARQQLHAESYDQTIRLLVVRKQKPNSLWGVLGRKPMNEILKGLRDERDRY